MEDRAGLGSGEWGAITTVQIRAFSGLLFLLVVIAVAIFTAAWSVDYWQAWLFLAVFAVASLAITQYLIKQDPELLERRVRAGPVAEQDRGQKIIQSLASLAFIATLVVPGIDHRLGWSTVPVWVVFAGDALVALGFLVVFFVFRENTFASATIEVEEGQRAISTGPYALVRHPMYAGALILLAGVPIALGSWWGLLAVAPMKLLIVLRLLAEERFLAKNLPGYADYRSRVRYRLAPFVW
jgi:protein-S-isoprenylcysteine O-methyltransferase Ste14